jgi:hypothetical protein
MTGTSQLALIGNCIDRKTMLPLILQEDRVVDVLIWMAIAGIPNCRACKAHSSRHFAAATGKIARRLYVYLLTSVPPDQGTFFVATACIRVKQHQVFLRLKAGFTTTR